MSVSREQSGRNGVLELPEYTIVRNPRARRVRLRVNMDGSVCIVVPPRGRASGFEDFVRQNVGWIRKQQAKFAALRESTHVFGFREGEVCYRGERIPVETVDVPGSTISLRLEEGRFILLRPVGAGDEDVNNLLRRWFRETARSVFHERVKALSETTAAPWQRIRIAEQSTKWGSCSSKGTLSFNWRLLIAPPEVLDYVVIHELAHLSVLNHSPDFWALVERQCPRHKEYRRWLNRYGNALML